MNSRAFKRITIALMLFLLSFTSKISAQNTIGFNIGIGTYDMSDLKSILKSSVQDNSLEPVLVSDFPPYFYYQPTLRFNGKVWNSGLKFSYLSSGSRWSIRDYSAEYRLDAMVRGYAPAIFIERNILKHDKLTCSLHCDAGFLLSKVDIKEHLNIWTNQYINSSYTVSSLNVFISPQLNARYPLVKKVMLEAFAGIQMDLIRGPLMENPKPSDYLKYLFKDGTSANWSGFRIGIGVCYQL